MRKLKLQVQISIDGFIAGKNSEMDWITWTWDDEISKYVAGITEPVDCILLGRNLAEGFIPTWAARAADPETAHFAQKMHTTPKVVFSKTLTESKWDNATLATGDIVEEVMALKNQPGKDIIAYGGATFVADLIRHELIDEFHLLVNPAALGSGMPIFTERTNLKLALAQPFPCGIVALQYTR